MLRTWRKDRKREKEQERERERERERRQRKGMLVTYANVLRDHA